MENVVVHIISQSLIEWFTKVTCMQLVGFDNLLTFEMILSSRASPRWTKTIVLDDYEILPPWKPWQVQQETRRKPDWSILSAGWFDFQWSQCPQYLDWPSWMCRRGKSTQITLLQILWEYKSFKNQVFTAAFGRGVKPILTNWRWAVYLLTFWDVLARCGW